MPQTLNSAESWVMRCTVYSTVDTHKGCNSHQAPSATLSTATARDESSRCVLNTNLAKPTSAIPIRQCSSTLLSFQAHSALPNRLALARKLSIDTGRPSGPVGLITQCGQSGGSPSAASKPPIA